VFERNRPIAVDPRTPHIHDNGRSASFASKFVDREAIMTERETEREEGLMGLLNAFGFDSQRTGSAPANPGPKAMSPKATGAFDMMAHMDLANLFFRSKSW
jgi:hypothetical protein